MTFEELPENEKDILESAPVLISLLAAGADLSMNAEEKKEAILFSHIKTFSSDPALRHFYREVEKKFATQIEELDRELPKEKKQRQEEIRTRLAAIEPILQQLGEPFTRIMHRSLNSYFDHVSKAHRNVIESFFIPIYIKGLTD